jgi:hypothetical protein
MHPFPSQICAYVTMPRTYPRYDEKRRHAEILSFTESDAEANGLILFRIVSYTSYVGERETSHGI